MYRGPEDHNGLGTYALACCTTGSWVLCSNCPSLILTPHVNTLFTHIFLAEMKTF